MFLNFWRVKQKLPFQLGVKKKITLNKAKRKEKNHKSVEVSSLCGPRRGSMETWAMSTWSLADPVRDLGASKCIQLFLSVWGVNSCFHWDCLYSLTLICRQVAADLLYGRIKFLGPQWLKLTSHSICLKFGDMGVWISRACFLFTWHFIFLSMIFITSSSSPSSTNSNIPIISTTLLIL